MRIFTHTSVAVICVLFLALGVSGCGLGIIASNVGSTSADDQGNALKVNYQRPPDESLNEFEAFIKGRNMEVTSKEGDTLTASGDLGKFSRGGNSQDIRMKVFSKKDGSNSSVVIITEYLNPTSGTYKRATNDTGIMSTKEEAQSTEFRTFSRLERILISRYGGDNVEATDSHLSY